ncbi:adenylate cyclase [Rhodoligotrophos appendicifer]|uniref:adenylate cyclase n=1 Tax=Rhodoligotrophos appendicifer TaxID=987056 RepID=UPI001961E40F|nr:adenylate cyclase [Rhodoligotrophos appendicifer]
MLDRPAIVDPEEIRAQLRRILESATFDVPGRLRHFLQYVVDETLAGRANRLKAYSIGIEVFDRSQSFDSQSDPVVRVEAGRLRRALERYYLMSGATDPILIEIPKGGYTPRFTLRAAFADDEAALPSVVDRQEPSRFPRQQRLWAVLAVMVVAIGVGGTYGYLRSAASGGSRALPESPALVVAPFIDLGGSPDTKLYAAGLTEEILSQLARFRELTVFGRETSATVDPMVDPLDLRSTLGVRFVVEGAVRSSADRLRVTARLLDLDSNAILWSETYHEDLTTRDLLTIEQDVAQKVATAIAQPYGTIFQAGRGQAQQNAPEDLEAYGCTLRFYSYRSELSSATHLEVRTCLEEAVARYPDFATAWAMLAYLSLDEDRFEFNPRGGQPSAAERALRTARQAVRLDPTNVRAQQALMTALFFNQQTADAFRVGEAALKLNPNDTELLGEYGSRVAQAGDWARGAELIRQALARNPGYSGFYDGVLALAAYMQNQQEEALSLIRRADMQKFPIYFAVAALIYHEVGLVEEATAARVQFLKMRPHFFDDLDAQLIKRSFNPQDRAKLAEGARRAGFPVLAKPLSPPAPDLLALPAKVSDGAP